MLQGTNSSIMARHDGHRVELRDQQVHDLGQHAFHPQAAVLHHEDTGVPVHDQPWESVRLGGDQAGRRALVNDNARAVGNGLLEPRAPKLVTDVGVLTGHEPQGDL